MTRQRPPARHERPAIDEAALTAARATDKLLAAASERGITRWETFLAPLPDLFRDADFTELRGAARRARAAFGPKDSIRDSLPAEVTEPFLVSVDRLIKTLARDAAERD